MDLQSWFDKNRRLILFLTNFIFLVLLGATISTWSDGKMRMFFCDVGQGDATYIRFPNNKDMLIDGGPNDKVLKCLSDNMPFYDRTIDVLVLTHPEADHITGLIEVLQRYKVNLVVNNKIEHKTSEYSNWLEELERHLIQYELKRGDSIILDTETKTEVLWPEKEKLLRWQKEGTNNLNQTSIVLRLTYKNFCALLTGDVGLDAKNFLTDKPCLVLKVPHHGSRNNLDNEFLEKIKSQISVISAGKNNRYAHPHQEVLKMLRDKDIKILRTDEMGTIKIISDGESYKIN